MSPFPPSATVSDPGPAIRALIALVLRVGLGLSLLNRGIVGYLGMKAGGGTGFGPSPLSIPPAIEPFYPSMVYAEMAIGLALVLGFFTTATTVLAAVMQLVIPVIQTAITISGLNPYQGPPGLNIAILDRLAASGPNQLLLIAAVLWFSPVATNRWALDRLIYSRPNGSAPPALAPPPPEPTAPAPEPGERSKTFIASREE
jgi:uncharacterized membrane protein YphA (DoxX/SURF4 family)